MIYRIGHAEIDTSTREIRQRGVPGLAEPRVFDFLEYLIVRRDRIVGKQELIDQLWGGRAVSDSVMARAAYAARRLLGDPAAIKTFYGKGYRLVAPLVEVDASAAQQAPRIDASSRSGEALIGRAQELNLAATCFDDVLHGDPRTLVVSGEAGIGKTALCERIAELGRRRGALSFWGKCSEVPGAPAYWPFIQLFREVIALEGHDSIQRLLPEYPEIGELVSPLAVASSAPAVGDHEQARFRLFDGVVRFLRAVSRVAPLTFVVDDLHCADTPSLLLSTFLVHHLADARVLLLVACRDREMRATEERARWARDMARSSSVRPCKLRGLGREEIDAFVEYATGDRPSTADLDYLVVQTAGNPFYLTQLAPFLGELEASSAAAGRALELRFPRTVLDAIESHLASFTPETRRALEAASVIGSDFDTSVLSLVLGADKPEVLALLEVPLDAGVLDELSSTELRFSHVLIRDALYQGLPAQLRSDLHRRTAESLERTMRGKSDLVASTLAYHFTEAATSATAGAAIRYGALAGDLALQRLAYEEAASQLEAAVEMVDRTPPVDDAVLCDLLLKLGVAQSRSGRSDAARATLRRAANLARELDVPQRLAEVALDLAPGFFSIETGVLDEFVVARLGEALEALGDGNHVLRARLLSRLAMALFWTDQVERRTKLCDELGELARVAGDHETRLRELTARHAVLWRPENLGARLRWTAEAVVLANELGDVDAELVNRCFRITDVVQAGDFDAALQEVAAFKSVAVAARQPECVWMAETYDHTFALLRGEYERVIRFGMQSITLGERVRHHNAYLTGGLYVALASAEVGRARDVLPALQNYAVRYPRMPYAALLAFITSRTGDRDLTLDLLERAMPLAMSGNRDILWFATMAELSECALLLGAKEKAAALRTALAPFSGMHAVVGYGVVSYGAVDRYLGQLSLVLEDWTEAIARLEAGIEQNRRMQAEAYVAHGQRELSLALLARDAPGDRRRSELLARESLRTAEHLGMTWLREQLTSQD